MLTPEKIRANWPHEEPFMVVGGVCGVCGYDYELPDFSAFPAGTNAREAAEAVAGAVT